MSAILRVVRNVPQHWVGDGFPVRSLFSYQEGSTFDPFLLLDYAGPHRFEPAQAKRGVGEHPHRGFETVTIVYQGELEHGDSSGSRGTIGPGDVQWMTAASGVVHEEFHSEQFMRDGGILEMVQLWVNLPAKDKLSSPKYQSIVDAQIPGFSLPDGAGTARVIAGELLGVRGPASTFTPINVWDLALTPPQTVNLPLVPGHTALAVVQSGTIEVEKTLLNAGEMVLFDRTGGPVAIQSSAAARVLVLTGEPLQEPVVGQGPFVMNTREQIREAILDYQSGKMGRLT
ncbi:MAG: pirin family protein [Planctomycetota bacterium]|nr:MAG: pirin family protein [Planctomycetota bacterium]